MNERHGERRDTPDCEPAPVVTSKARSARWYDRRQGHTDPGGARTMVRPIPESEPAPTIGAMGLSSGRDRWIEERPATTVTGDPSLGSPGHHDEEHRQMGEGSVRVTLEEAAILQGFRPDYPFQGSRTAKFTQVGNAVPPPLARVVIEALVQPTAEEVGREA